MTVGRGAVIATAELDRMIDDLEFAAQIGLDHVRLDVPWVTAQPRAGGEHGGTFEDLITLAVHARGLGLAPWFRLLQPAVPHWFDDEGGFTDERTAGRYWPRWVELVAERLGSVSAGWVPFEAPFAMGMRLLPDDPRRHGELMHTLVVAWRDAWRVLRGGPPVATSIDVAAERPADDSPRAIEAARRRDRLRWDLWLGGLTDGVVRIPGRADRPLADLDGACDVLGIAVRTGIEAALHRTAEMGPPRPLAVTYRPPDGTDTAQAEAITAMWRDVRGAEGELDLSHVTAGALLDAPGRPGIATADRRVKDSGEAFLAG